MKHPCKVFFLAIVVLAAVAAAILMTMRYLDVLQKQFDFLRGLLARRNGGAPVAHEGGFSEEFSDTDESEDDSFSANEEYTDYNNDDLKF